MNAMLRQNRQMLRPLLAAAWLTLMAATGWAANITITPTSPATSTPVTFTVTNCENCFDLVWEFKKIGDASVVNGGDGYTITKTFAIAGNYRAMVTGLQAVGGYSQYVNRTKEFTVTAAPFTIVITPNSKWTVRGTIGQDDGIICAVGAKPSLCEETYAPGQHLHLKVIVNEGEDLLGWKVNDQLMSDEDFLNMLVPK